MDYPKDVAGIALIDSATPYQFDLPTYPTFYWVWCRTSALLPPLARVGRPGPPLNKFPSLPPGACRAAGV